MEDSRRSHPGFWSEISHAVLIANILVTVVGVGAHAAVMKLTGADDLVQFAQVLARTAPLALAVAVIVFLVLWQLGMDDFNFGLTLVACASTLFMATWVANRFGDLRVTEPVRSPTQQSAWGLQSAAEYALGMLLAYYQAYGVRDFWSSFAVGGALGWIWNRGVERATARDEDVATAEQKSESDRLAA